MSNPFQKAVKNISRLPGTTRSTATVNGTPVVKVKTPTIKPVLKKYAYRKKI